MQQSRTGFGRECFWGREERLMGDYLLQNYCFVFVTGKIKNQQILENVGKAQHHECSACQSRRE